MALSEAAAQDFVGKFAKMRALAAHAMTHARQDARALYSAATAYRVTGDTASMRAVLEHLVRVSPHTHFLFELGVAHEYAGDFDAAARAYEEALKLEPLNYRARHALAQLRPQTRADISALEADFRIGDDAEGWRSLHLGHALAKAHEDVGERESGFAWLARGKQRRRTLRPYNAALEAALADAAIGAYASGRDGFAGDEPIFVTGLPRSGTTLVDRILSSHPMVSSAGEIGNFVQLLKLQSGSTTPATLDVDTLGRAGDVDYAAQGRLYIDSTRPLTGARARFIDKAPSNYLLAGLIHRALPNARIVCLRRHPLDSVLSNFKQIFPFDDRFYDYVTGLESAAHKVVQFERLAAHWARTLPGERFTIVQYETLVAEQAPESRRLLAFCGLDWDPRCLDFHKNAAGVATPSAKQVRTAMYAGAAGRFATYGALLDPARRVLEAAGVALD